jgi:exodeoxyribonuclease X
MIIRVLDCETSGLAPPAAAVIELAYCDLHFEKAAGWQVAGGEAWFCDPGHPISPEISAIHHIVDADVAGKEPFATVCRRLFERTSDAEEIVAVAAHNSRFDRLWLTDDLVGNRHWIDTYRAALWLWPEAPAYSVHALRYWLKPAGLDRAVAASHRAYGDAYVTAHILREMLSRTTGKQLVAWSKGPALLPRFTFGKHAMKPLADVDPGYLEWILKQDMDEDVKFTARHWLKHHEAKEREPA